MMAAHVLGPKMSASETRNSGERRYAWAAAAVVLGNLLADIGLIAYGLMTDDANWLYIFGAMVTLSIANRVALSRINRRWNEFRQTNVETGAVASESGGSAD